MADSERTQTVPGWPDPALNRNEHVRQVCSAQIMFALTRNRPDTRLPTVNHGEWDALESLATGVPVDDPEKFDLWCEGTAKFFRTARNVADFRPWLNDAFRIVRRLNPAYVVPLLGNALDKHQATIELEIVRKGVVVLPLPSLTYEAMASRPALDFGHLPRLAASESYVADGLDAAKRELLDAMRSQHAAEIVQNKELLAALSRAIGKAVACLKKAGAAQVVFEWLPSGQGGSVAQQLFVMGQEGPPDNHWLAQLIWRDLDNAVAWRAVRNQVSDFLDAVLIAIRPRTAEPLEAKDDRPPCNSAAGQPSVSSMLSAKDIATRFGLSHKLSTVETALRRLRDERPDCFREVEGARRNEPRYLYRLANVQDRIEKIDK